MQSALQFAIASKFYNDNLIDAKAYKVEWLVGLFFVVHDVRRGAEVRCH